MVHQRTLYLETSLFGFLFDTKPENKEKKDAVKQLFKQIRQGLFEGVTSELTASELAQARLDHLIREYDVRIVQMDKGEVYDLAQRYVDDKVLMEDQYDDAVHVAAASVLGVDVLVSLNLKHIVNLRLGYRPLEVAMPQEVILDVG